jgi:hypothetical protein
MTVPAAMLALLATETAETLDNLRLAAAAVQKHRLALGGMETMANGMKLMLQSAVLGAGAEGDPEERLGVGPRAVDRLPALGLATLAATVPLARVAVTAFHRPALSAAAYEYSYHPAHSSYVWGGGRSYGRSSSWG